MHVLMHTQHIRHMHHTSFMHWSPISVLFSAQHVVITVQMIKRSPLDHSIPLTAPIFLPLLRILVNQMDHSIPLTTLHFLLHLQQSFLHITPICHPPFHLLVKWQVTTSLLVGMRLIPISVTIYLSNHHIRVRLISIAFSLICDIACHNFIPISIFFLHLQVVFYQDQVLQCW